ncbi:MAG: hypothetical protein K2K57_14955 [Oscillospiraceae bacterium]|nr:hypothetical protein [Oscillospiraceae bacterium]
MIVSTNNLINTALLQSLAQNKTAAANAEPTVSGAANGELVNIRKYDILEKSRDYEDMRVTEEPEEEISEIERIRGMFSETDAMSKMFAKLLKTGNGFGEDDIAEICGVIGSEIDSSYSAGRLTKDEYETLNKELREYSDALTEKTVFITAWGNFIEDNIRERKKILHDIIDGEYQERCSQRFSAEMKKYLTDKKKSDIEQNELGALWSQYMNSFDINKDSLFERIQNARLNTGASRDIINKWNLNDRNAKRLYDSSDAQITWDVKMMTLVYNGLKEGRTWGSMNEELESTLGRREDYRI